MCVLVRFYRHGTARRAVPTSQPSTEPQIRWREVEGGGGTHHKHSQPARWKLFLQQELFVDIFILLFLKQQTWQPQLSSNAVRYFFFLRFVFPSPTCAINTPRSSTCCSQCSRCSPLQQLVGTFVWQHAVTQSQESCQPDPRLGGAERLGFFCFYYYFGPQSWTRRAAVGIALVGT